MSDEEITAARKLKCVERELAMRQRVYPGWVLKGRMTADQARGEIAVMQAILEDYKNQAEQTS
jgi:hypothetical protein